MEDMGRVRQARQHRREWREHERLLDEDKPAAQETWEDLNDGWEFRSQELGALGTEVTRGVSREAGYIAKGIFREGVDLTVDLLTSLATFGFVEPPSPFNGKYRRRRRY